MSSWLQNKNDEKAIDAQFLEVDEKISENKVNADKEEMKELKKTEHERLEIEQTTLSNWLHIKRVMVVKESQSSDLNAQNPEERVTDQENQEKKQTTLSSWLHTKNDEKTRLHIS